MHSQRASGTAVLDRSQPAAWPTVTRQQRGAAAWTRWFRFAVLGAGVVGMLGVVSFALLFYADYATAGNGSQDPRARAAWAWDRGDRLHYAVHLVLGRAFDLCPCARNAAGAQYYRARFHALTPTQKAAIANVRPATPHEFGAYLVAPVLVGLEWVGDGVVWLAGDRPATHVVVALDRYEVAPAEVRILRGTRVTWRNMDELGEAHTVTSDAGQAFRFHSDWLLPGDEFQFTFTERGRFRYYCLAHGDEGLEGMAGEIVVE